VGAPERTADALPVAKDEVLEALRRQVQGLEQALGQIKASIQDLATPAAGAPGKEPQ
jgi:prefoldin subunit 5